MHFHHIQMHMTTQALEMLHMKDGALSGSAQGCLDLIVNWRTHDFGYWFLLLVTATSSTTPDDCGPLYKSKSMFMHDASLMDRQVAEGEWPSTLIKPHHG